MDRMRGLRAAGVAVAFLFAGGPAWAEVGGTGPGSFAAAQPEATEAAPVAPLPSGAAPAVGPGYETAAPHPAVAAEQAPVVVVVPAAPFYQKWWFWTAVGAFAVATVVILAASSDSGPPRTNLGNMPAF